MRRPRWFTVLAGWCLAATLCGCTAAGSATRATPAAGLAPTHAFMLTVPTGALAVSPAGTAVVVYDATAGLCVRPLTGGAGHCTTAGLPSPVPRTPPADVSVAFSADGRWLAVGRDLGGSRPGSVWLLDTAAPTDVARAVPAIAGVAARTGSGVIADAYRNGSAYLAMAWDAGTGHLALANLVIADSGPITTLVDVDPGSLLVRPVGRLAEADQGFTGALAAGGGSGLAGVAVSDQLAADVVRVDGTAGTRTDLGTVITDAARTTPVAVSPDGRWALVAARVGTDPGAARVVDLTAAATVSPATVGGPIATAVFSPDSTLLAALEPDGQGSTLLTIRPLHTPVNSTVVATLTGTPPAGARLTWSPSGLLVVSGNTDGAAPGLSQLAWWLQ